MDTDRVELQISANEQIAESAISANTSLLLLVIVATVIGLILLLLITTIYKRVKLRETTERINRANCHDCDSRCVQQCKRIM